MTGKKTDAKCIKAIEILTLLNSDYGYLFIKNLDLSGYFLYSARLGVDKNQLELTKEITNKGDRLQYIHL